MDHALPLDHDVDVLLPDSEQPAGLDDLKALVHKRCAVYCDPSPHVPGRMLKGVGCGDPFELLPALSVKSAAGGGEDELFDLFPPACLKALEYCAVFAVDRDYLRPVSGGGSHHVLSGYDERFLVRKSEPPAAGDGGQRGNESGLAGDRVYNRLRLAFGQHLANAVLSGIEYRVRIPASCAEIGQRVRTADGAAPDTETSYLFL